MLYQIRVGGTKEMQGNKKSEFEDTTSNEITTECKLLLF